MNEGETGTLLDVTPDPARREMVVWVKRDDGEVVPVRRPFAPSFYVGGPRARLDALAATLPMLPGVGAPTLEPHLIGLAPGRRRVLKVPVADTKRLLQVARLVDAQGEYRDLTLYDVDLRASQRFFTQEGTFPFARVRREGDRLVALDAMWDLDYETPALRTVELDAQVEDKARQTGRVVALRLGDERLEGSEERILREAAARILALDPDVVYTRGGDRWLMGHLEARAAALGVPWELGRDPALRQATRRGRTFVSYGQVKYSAPTHPLVGRAHVDLDASFFFGESGLPGIVDIARISCIPLGEIARLESGTAVTAMQIARAKRQGRLVPWKKNMPEKPKTLRSLVKADRGGYIFDPRVGLHGDVVELDFASLYPAIIAKHNLGAETILCTCCDPATLPPDAFVPQIGFHVCRRRRGLVPDVLTDLVKRRGDLKKRRKATKDPAKFAEYKGRVDALKWLNVVSFGYQGYKNARFGCIEAHEATTAWAREVLLTTAEVARDAGYEFLHGIVDSLWLERTSPAAISPQELAERVEREVGIPFELQGRYHWIVFLPTRMHVAAGAPRIGAPNRFYGCFDHAPDVPTRSQAGQDVDHIAGGALKVRGVEMRQSSTPPIVVRAQEAALDVLSRATSADAFREAIPAALDAARPHLRRLREGACEPAELLITLRVTRGVEGRTQMTHGAAALRQMAKLGFDVPAGDSVSFLIADGQSRDPATRVRVASQLRAREPYDAAAYETLVVRALASLLLPLGYDEARVAEEMREGTRQARLPCV